MSQILTDTTNFEKRNIYPTLLKEGQLQYSRKGTRL